ncbi:MAG TPA: adenosylcobalamin-dependent ribonucleoside-diphosphate reductase [Blastocatellia bacterium]|nr:adenosylcobalamin-dependent ribonucleoside-diphosphate reductase [Blastocatellia bacterium]
MQLTDTARRVLEARYLRRNLEGKVTETPSQLFERVARAVSEAELLDGTARQAEEWEERFHEMMTSLDFLPNSPTLMNAGTKLGQLSACYVLPIEDTMESIFGTLRNMALVQRTGGGTGFSFSHLRPAGDPLSSTGGRASGPVSFMKIYDCATENIKLGGRRRGANMGVLRVDHPDIEQFINAKRESSTLRSFNISVGATDEFMSAIESDGEIELRHPANGRAVGRRSARALFESICDAAWATGDPGLIFLDTIGRANPTPAAGHIESTNPCGEVPLLPYESCNLGSINLTRFVNQSHDKPALDWDRLRAIVADSVRFLDDVISINRFPIKATERMTLANRKIGLGVMGFAEMLILLGIPYDSDEAAKTAGEIMKFIADKARAASVRLAEKRGVFPNWEKSVYRDKGLRLRNATLTSIAPTGTISMIAGTSSSIEPLFALAYRRKHILDGETFKEFNPVFLRHLKRRGLASKDLLDEVMRHGRLSEVATIPEDLRRLFATALEVPANRHVQIQAAFQRHVDNAVSKTINLPAEATAQDIAGAYRLAYKLGCKGVTVFRYGSKSDQVLEIGADESPHEREYFTKCDPGACRL